MRQALANLPRYIGTSMVSRHRMFAWIDGDVLPDATIIVFARDDDYFFGVLQSRPHTLWAEAIRNAVARGAKRPALHPHHLL